MSEQKNSTQHTHEQSETGITDDEGIDMFMCTKTEKARVRIMNATYKAVVYQAQNGTILPT